MSVSTVLDGKLVDTDGFKHSDGAANVLRKKGKVQPTVWREIQRKAKLRFRLLDTTDVELKTLSKLIFESTRQAIDDKLAERSMRAP